MFRGRLKYFVLRSLIEMSKILLLIFNCVLLFYWNNVWKVPITSYAYINISKRDTFTFLISLTWTFSSHINYSADATRHGVNKITWTFYFIKLMAKYLATLSITIKQQAFAKILWPTHKVDISVTLSSLLWSLHMSQRSIGGCNIYPSFRVDFDSLIDIFAPNIKMSWFDVGRGQKPKPNTVLEIVQSNPDLSFMGMLPPNS